MSPSPLGAFYRSPLGAFYRSPLGAFTGRPAVGVLAGSAYKLTGRITIEHWAQVGTSTASGNQWVTLSNFSLVETVTGSIVFASEGVQALLVHLLISLGSFTDPIWALGAIVASTFTGFDPDTDTWASHPGWQSTTTAPGSEYLFQAVTAYNPGVPSVSSTNVSGVGTKVFHVGSQTFPTDLHGNARSMEQYVVSGNKVTAKYYVEASRNGFLSRVNGPGFVLSFVQRNLSGLGTIRRLLGMVVLDTPLTAGVAAHGDFLEAVIEIDYEIMPGTDPSLGVA